MGRKHGFSFSWRRATSYSTATGAISRKTNLALPLLSLVLILVVSGIAFAQKTVRVRTYTRKDGTVVKAHERSAPGSRKSGSTVGVGRTSSPASSPVNSPAEDPNAPITNSDVIYMITDGVSPEEVKTIIVHARSSFDTCARALQELKSNGVSDDLITAMVVSSLSEGTQPAVTPPVPGAPKNAAATNDNHSPELQGFRLGTIAKEANLGRALYADTDARGVQHATLLATTEGVSMIRLEFLDGALESIAVTYDGSVKWSSEQEFLTAVAARLGLPNIWDRRNSIEARIVRQGFTLEATYTYGIQPRLHLYDPKAQETIAKRKAEQEEMKRRAFKP